MTQAIINTMNNAEQLLTGVKQATNRNCSKNNFTDFASAKSNTIADVANNKTTSIQAEKELSFKNELEKASKSANEEAALDLTLAKDVQEIISQLKEAVDDVLDNQILPTEEITVNTETSSDTIDTDEEKLYEQIAEIPTNLFAQLMEINTALKSEFNMQQDSTVIKTVTNLAETTADEIITSKPQEDTQTNTLEALIDEEKVKELNIESIKAETNTSDGETLMQKQTPEENALKAIINHNNDTTFEIKLDTTTNGQIKQTQQPEVSPSRIFDQISKHIENLHNGSKVSIVLKPESLGKLDIQLLTTKEGLSAQFTVSTQEARDLLMKGLDGLKETLATHGVSCDNISVKVSDSQKSEYQEDWTEQDGSEGGNANQQQAKKEEKEKGLFEKTMKETCES